MDAARKSLEIQAQIRQNASEMKTAFSDLQRWEQEMKTKETEFRKSSEPVEKKKDKFPVRSKMPSNKQNNENRNEETKTEPVAIDNVGNSKGKVTDENLKLSANEKGILDRKVANEAKEKGNSYVKLGFYDKAIESYTMAIDIFPQDAIFYSNRALCYLKQECHEQCIEDCDRALEIDKCSVKAYYRRMQANESLGNNMDALKDCTSILLIEPKNTEAKKALDRINARLHANVKNLDGPNFSPPSDNLVEILPIDKPPYKRSTKPLRRVPISDVIVTRKNDMHNDDLKISDEDIDKLFNSDCGTFVEVKNTNSIQDIKLPQTDNKAQIENTTLNVKKTTESKVEKVKPLPDILPETIKSKEPTESTASLKNKSNLEIQKKVNEIQTNDKKLENTLTKVMKSTTSEIIHITLPPAPTSPAQFYSHWKCLPNDLKYKYLKSIDISIISKVLGAGFDSPTLSGIINILHDYYMPKEDPTLVDTLLQISTNNQISILSMFMSGEDSTALTKILKNLKSNNVNVSTVNIIANNFGLHLGL